jgi:FkbM family methyltransferase
MYGFGTIGVQWFRSFIVDKVNIQAVFDRNPQYCGMVVSGVPILSLDKIDAISREANVFISLRHQKYTITKMFRNLGFSSFYYEDETEVPAIENRISMVEAYRRTAAQDGERIASARACFQERKSLECFDAAMDAHTNGNFEHLEKYGETQFVAPKDVFTFNDREVFCDVGAYMGNTSFGFVSEMNNKYEHIYAFEPGELENLIFSAAVNRRGLCGKIDVIRSAVGNIDGYVSFESDNSDMGAKITDGGDVEVPCITLDKFFVDEGRAINAGHAPTYIYMDIEGAESDALDGAKEVIGKYRPKLLISVYHLFEHYYEIPLKIQELSDNGYTLYMRHYWSLWDTVCLAVPKD